MERTVVARRVVVGSSKRGTRGTWGTMVTRSLDNRSGSQSRNSETTGGLRPLVALGAEEEKKAEDAKARGQFQGQGSRGSGSDGSGSGSNAQ
jgi:hypothetical protein